MAVKTVLDLGPAQQAQFVVIMACEPVAYQEIALAITSGRLAWSGRRSAIFCVEGSSPQRAIFAGLGSGLQVFAIGQADLRNSAALWQRMNASDPTGVHSAARYLDALPDDIEVVHVYTPAACLGFEVDVSGADPIQVTVSAQSVEANLDVLEGPATWENSDPMSMLLSELGISRDSIIPTGHRVFTVIAFALPVYVAFGLLAALDISVAVALAGILLTFALTQPWKWYSETIANHLRNAREQRCTPTRLLARRTFYFCFGIAVRWYRDGTHVLRTVEFARFLQHSNGLEACDAPERRRKRMRRPYFLWNRLMARRSALWWNARVRPVYGSYPPCWRVQITPSPLLRGLDKIRSRWILRRIESRLRRISTTQTGAIHVYRRFLRTATWQLSTRNRAIPVHYGTAAHFSRVLFGSSEHAVWPPPRTRPLKIVHLAIDSDVDLVSFGRVGSPGAATRTRPVEG